MEKDALHRFMSKFWWSAIALGLLFVAAGPYNDGDTQALAIGAEAIGLTAYVSYSLLRRPMLRQISQTDGPTRWTRAYTLVISSIALFGLALLSAVHTDLEAADLICLVAGTGALIGIGRLIYLHHKAVRPG